MSTTTAGPVSRVSTPSGERYDGVIDLARVKAAHVPFYPTREAVTADGNTAAALATLQMWRAILYPGFPITPSTKWIETVAAKVGAQKGTAKRVKLMEAEHAVADYMVGAAAACRDLIVSTATSSVGLDHMTETTRSLGASGLGNVMIIDVYRATANFPLCIEGDPSDALAHRDDGFIQICARGKQQIYDTVIQAPVLGMHADVMTPTMPGYYGIKDSHRNAKFWVEADSAIHAFQDKWIKECALPGTINGDTAMGNCVTSRHFQGFKVAQKRRIERALELLPEIGADFEKTFGRPGLAYFDEVGFKGDEPVDVVVVSMGPDFGTFESIRGEWSARNNTSTAGLAMRLINPFPREAVRKRLANAKVVLVVNQAHHSGRGHLTLDIADALAGLDKQPRIVSAFAGMGGADVSESTWEVMLDEGRDAITKAPRQPYMVFHEGARL